MSKADGIHVARWGDKGPTVLLIHGGPQGGPAGGAATFASQQALAERGWQLALPDRPGHGETPTRGPEDMEVEAEWIAEMFGDGVHLVGHSYGGCCALAALALKPEAVKSVTLLETPVMAAAPDDPAVQAFVKSLHEELEKDAPPPAVLLGFGQLVNLPFDKLGPPPAMDQIVAMGEALKVMRQPDTWDGNAALDAINEHDIPVLTMTGGWSPAFGAMADAVAEKTGGEHVVVDVGHHFPQYGDDFNDVFEGFLKAVESRSGAEV